MPTRSHVAWQTEVRRNFTREVKIESRSVRTIDSILTFLDAHRAKADDIFGTEKRTGSKLAKGITRLA
jgi:hypothetical protein